MSTFGIFMQTLPYVFLRRVAALAGLPGAR
jgi:hypothetical protein